MNRPEDEDTKIGFVSAETMNVLTNVNPFIHGKPKINLPIFDKNLGNGKILVSAVEVDDDDNSEE